MFYYTLVLFSLTKGLIGRRVIFLSPISMNVLCPGSILMISADSPGRDQCNLTDSKVALCTT